MVIALVGLIFILLLVFVLIIRGQSKKYAKKTDSGELAALLPFSTGGSSAWGGVFLSPGNASALIGGAAQASYTISVSCFAFNLKKKNGAVQPGGGGEAPWSIGME